MKKVVYICDLCGWQMGEPYVMFQVEDREAGERHLCQICAERIKAAAPEPKATKEAEPKEEKPKKEHAPRQKVDRGKVIALAKAGWTISKIAEEMKCSDQTVRLIMKAAREEKEKAEIEVEE